MPNPATINCPDGQWKLVSTDQIFGYIYKLGKKPSKYLYTYRLNGEAAPTNSIEGVEIFTKEEKKLIVAGVGIDIYVMAIGADGQVRYDWWW